MLTVLDKSVGSPIRAQTLDPIAGSKKCSLNLWVKLRFFETTLESISCTLNSRPTDFSRIILHFLKIQGVIHQN